MDWYFEVWRKFGDFEGRSRRTEFWMFTLFNVIIWIGLGIIETILGSFGILGALYGLAVLVPSIAVTVRRLHDIGLRGWWVLIGFVPVIGVIALLVMMLIEGQPGTNQYGPSPKVAGA